MTYVNIVLGKERKNTACLIDRVRANEDNAGDNLKTADPTATLFKALPGTDRRAAAQAAVDLISQAADGSNLTLDPDLDSFHT